MRFHLEDCRALVRSLVIDAAGTFLRVTRSKPKCDPKDRSTFGETVMLGESGGSQRPPARNVNGQLRFAAFSMLSRKSPEH